MGKNVYSLVLLDNVVDAVDRLACERGASRSGVINQILAEYLSCPVPETRMRDIFSCMEASLSELHNFTARWQPSESMFCIRSPLRYRYHPTVRYSLELFRDEGPYLGKIRVAFRTQNADLLNLSEAFFQVWEALENEWLGSRFPKGHVPCSAEPGKYARQLLCPQSENDCGGQRVAEAILAYLREFDADLKSYFAEAENPEQAAQTIEKHYLIYLKDALIL